MFMLIKDTYLHSRSIDGSMDRVIDGNTGASVTEGDTGASVHTNVPTHLHAYLPA